MHNFLADSRVDAGMPRTCSACNSYVGRKGLGGGSLQAARRWRVLRRLLGRQERMSGDLALDAYSQHISLLRYCTTIVRAVDPCMGFGPAASLAK